MDYAVWRYSEGRNKLSALEAQTRDEAAANQVISKRAELVGRKPRIFYIVGRLGGFGDFSRM